MRWWSQVRYWVERLVFRRREDEALRDEVRFHIEMEARKLQGEGRSPREAWREANLRFGGADRMMERAREARGLHGLVEAWSDFRRGLRGLLRTPAFTVVAVGTLAVGVGAVTAAFSLVEGVLLRPLPWSEPDELVELRELGEGRRFYPSYPNFADWRDRTRSLEAVVAVQPMGEQAVRFTEGARSLPALGVSREFFETLGMGLVAGRSFTREEQTPGGPPAVMVSEALWRSELGSPARLDGVRLDVAGRSVPVIGVVPAEHRFVVEADLYHPLEAWPGTVRSAHAYRVFGRLAPDSDLARAAAELDGIARAIREEYPGESQAERVEVRPLRDVYLGPREEPLALLMGAAALLLVLVAVNVGATVLARGTDRLQELEVRASLGAGRGRLVRQLLAESLALALPGALAGLGLAWAAVHFAILTAPNVLPRMDGVAVNLRVALFAVAVAVGATFLASLAPTVSLSRKGAGRGVGQPGNRSVTRRTRGPWALLLAGESALALVLLVGAGLMVQGVRAIVERPENWSDEGVMQVRYTLASDLFASPAEGMVFMDRLHETLHSAPGVASVALANLTPLDAGNMTAPAQDPEKADAPPNYTGIRVVGDAYFETLGVPLLQGRLWLPGETGVAVVNQALARRLWPGEDPLGRSLVSNFMPDRSFTVVGVVADARDWRFSGDDQTEFFLPWTAAPEFAFQGSLLVRFDGGDAASQQRELERRLREFERRVPWEVAPLADALSGTAADRRFVSAVLTAFAAIAAAVALAGILGVVGYLVRRRQREMGIRLALGASSAGIRTAVLRSVLVAVIPGTVVGLGAAALTSRTLTALLYQVSPLDIRVYLGAALAFVGLALLAGDLPARRAAATDPARVLRAE